MSEVSIEKAREISKNEIVYQYELCDNHRLNGNFECVDCNEKISVHTNKNKLYFFQHPHSSCILKKPSREDKELFTLNANYHRSGRHSDYQDRIIKYLEHKKFTSIEKEKSFYVNGKVKHRADIYFESFDKKFVIEVQISPLSFRNILKRIAFYKSQGIYLIWVVDFDYVDSRQFLKDITKYNSNNNEFFSFNSSNNLVVHYQKISYWKKKNDIWEEWKPEKLNFNNLKFNKQDMTYFYYNREKIRKNLYLDNPLLLLNHIRLDSDIDLVKKLKYYKKYYSIEDPKFLKLIDAIFLKEYNCWLDRQYYDIFTFLIKEDKIKTIEFLLYYGLRRRKIYNPKEIPKNNYPLFLQENVKSIRKELSYYYFLDEDRISSFKIEIPNEN